MSEDGRPHDGFRVDAEDVRGPAEPPLTAPTRQLVAMVVVLAAGVAGVAAIAPRLIEAFQASPALNGAIVGVFAIGVIYAFRQPWSLRVEIAWLNAFADGAHADRRDPHLLAPMAAMLRGRGGDGRLALSPLALRSLLDGVAARLDERKEITRYLIGLLVFLGLLGTFWGLLDVVGAVARAIAGLDLSAGGDGFLALRDSLSAPISGMGVAFSSSLFGLAGSLALGLLELLAAQSQNRFYSDLETWLAKRTRLSGGGANEDEAPGLSYVAALLEQTAESIQSFERAAAKNAETSAAIQRALERLAARGDADETTALLRALDERLARVGEETTAAQSRAADDVAKEIKLLARTLSAGGGGA